jgi:hypothetical protein
MSVNNRDYLNVIERKIVDELRLYFNTVNGGANSGKVYVSGQYPEPETMTFPSIVIQQIGSGFEESMIGEKVTMTDPVDGSVDTYTGEIFGIAFLIHIIIDKEAELDVGTSPQGSTKYRQRRLLNWLMLNIANTINSIDWEKQVMAKPTGLDYNPQYDASVEVIQRNLQAWRDVGFNPALQFWGASAQMMLTFKNYR